MPRIGVDVLFWRIVPGLLVEWSLQIARRSLRQIDAAAYCCESFPAGEPSAAARPPAALCRPPADGLRGLALSPEEDGGLGGLGGLGGSGRSGRAISAALSAGGAPESEPTQSVAASLSAASGGAGALAESAGAAQGCPYGPGCRV